MGESRYGTKQKSDHQCDGRISVLIEYKRRLGSNKCFRAFYILWLLFNPHPIKQLSKLLSAVDIQFLVRLFEIIANRIEGNTVLLGDLLCRHAVGILHNRVAWRKNVDAKRPLTGALGRLHDHCRLRLLAVKKPILVATELQSDQLGKGWLDTIGTCLGVACQQKNLLRCHADSPCKFVLADLLFFNNLVFCQQVSNVQFLSVNHFLLAKRWLFTKAASSMRL